MQLVCRRIFKILKLKVYEDLEFKKKLMEDSGGVPETRMSIGKQTRKVSAYEFQKTTRTLLGTRVEVIRFIIPL